jgi:hypothetical protein
LARAIIGGLSVSVVLTVFVVPAAYLLIHRSKPNENNAGDTKFNLINAEQHGVI